MHSTTPPSRSEDKVAAASYRSNRYRPTLERCEGRILLTTYTVTALTDAGVGEGDRRRSPLLSQAGRRRRSAGHHHALPSPAPFNLARNCRNWSKTRGITIAGPGAGFSRCGEAASASKFSILRNPCRRQRRRSRA